MRWIRNFDAKPMNSRYEMHDCRRYDPSYAKNLPEGTTPQLCFCHWHHQRKAHFCPVSFVDFLAMYTKALYQQNHMFCATSPASSKAIPSSVVFATSGMGGMLGWALVHPFNTVAVRSNLASASGQTFSLREMLAKQGWMSVYDGLSAGMMRQVFYATSRLGLFETFRDILHEYRGKTDFASR